MLCGRSECGGRPRRTRTAQDSRAPTGQVSRGPMALWAPLACSLGGPQQCSIMAVRARPPLSSAAKVLSKKGEGKYQVEYDNGETVPGGIRRGAGAAGACAFGRSVRPTMRVLRLHPHRRQGGGVDRGPGARRPARRLWPGGSPPAGKQRPPPSTQPHRGRPPERQVPHHDARLRYAPREPARVPHTCGCSRGSFARCPTTAPPTRARGWPSWPSGYPTTTTWWVRMRGMVRRRAQAWRWGGGVMGAFSRCGVQRSRSG